MAVLSPITNTRSKYDQKLVHYQTSIDSSFFPRTVIECEQSLCGSGELKIIKFT